MQLISSIVSMPLPLRLFVLCLFGACLGAAVNLGIYRLAYLRRRISPWSRTRGEIAPRRWLDRIPIVGWLGMRRESKIQGRGFWIRPMLLELCFAIGIPALYCWEVVHHALVSPPLAPHIVLSSLAAAAILHSQFALHVVLFALIAVATFIDIDEQTIPDAVTVPGTLVALLLMTLCSALPLPAQQLDVQNARLDDLLLPLRFDFPDGAAGFLSRFGSLAVGLACFLDWSGALLPRHWRLGVGVGKSWRVMWRRIFSRPEWKWILPMAIVGCSGIVATWLHGGRAWHGLLSSLIGMTAGGAIIWTIRFIAGWILQREAMGFGDVTLMIMIGAWLGWQPVLVVFFLSPFAAVIVGLLQLMLIRENVIAFGPFLSLATLIVVLFWGPIWDYCHLMFETWWLVPAAIIICMPILVLMLLAVRTIRRRMTGE